MPSTRRRTAHNPTTANQSTLSFKNKVTKHSSSAADLLGKKLSKPKLNEQAEDEIIREITVPEPEVESQVIEETENKRKEPQVIVRSSPTKPQWKRKTRRSTDDTFEVAEKEAKKISDAKVRKYWKAEEDARLAPRVHQRDLSLHEKILRHFDLSSQYGPCIGVPRLARWKRANSLSLNPPIEVLAVLMREEAKEQNPNDLGPRQCGHLAYIDELAGGRVLLVE